MVNVVRHRDGFPREVRDVPLLEVGFDEALSSISEVFSE